MLITLFRKIGINLNNKKKEIMPQKEIWIENDILFYKDHETIENASISSIKYAYVQILGNIPFLFLFSERQHYISTELNGFEEVYKQLTERFYFDDDTFFAICKTKKEDDKVKIWIKKEPQNYQLLDEYITDGDLGYEVFANPKQMISWDITYDELEATGYVETYFETYGSKYLKFKYPVRIEGLLINQLEIYANNIVQKHPIKEYFVKLFDESNTEKSYKELRKLWLEDDIDVNLYGYERTDQCYLSFVLAKGIETNICYTYDEEYSYDDGATSLHFYNKREYKQFLENKEYEKVMDISATLSFLKKLPIKINYRDNTAIKHIPQKVKLVLKDKSGIWIDQVNHKIGFVGTETALILDLASINYFEIINVLPAKGSGYSDFIVQLNTKESLYIFTEDTYFFNQFAEQMYKLTKKEVKIPEAFYNC